MPTFSPATGPVTVSQGDIVVLNGPGGATSSTGALPITFNCRSGPGRQAPTLVIQAQGAATTVTATLQVSFDGGTTWEQFGSAASLNLLQPPAVQIVPGPLYRVDLTTVTGGTTTVSVALS